jgi:hypothetical protein
MMYLGEIDESLEMEEPESSPNMGIYRNVVHTCLCHSCRERDIRTIEPLNAAWHDAS